LTGIGTPYLPVPSDGTALGANLGANSGHEKAPPRRTGRGKSRQLARLGRGRLRVIVVFDRLRLHVLRLGPVARVGGSGSAGRGQRLKRASAGRGAALELHDDVRRSCGPQDLE